MELYGGSPVQFPLRRLLSTELPTQNVPSSGFSRLHVRNRIALPNPQTAEEPENSDHFDHSPAPKGFDKTVMACSHSNSFKVYRRSGQF